MSRSITIVFVLLIIIIAGFAFINYSRLNQMKSDLLKREELLGESERLLKEQETSISELAEKMREVIRKQEHPQHEGIVSNIEGELRGLQLKVDELVQMRKSDTVDIVLFGEEKAKLETLLSEREGQWQEKAEESKRIISSLHNEIQKYELESKLINEKILDIEGYLASEQSQRKELEQDLTRFQETIEHLQGQLALKQDDEKYVQQISELLSTTQELKEEISKKDSTLVQFQKEYQEIVEQLNAYRQYVEELKQELANAKEIEDALRKEQLAEKETGYYEVKSGDNLWNIARGKYRDGIAWTKIFKANQDQIQNPDLIYPYQQFVIPD
ncbi:MAG: LysM peptidoglycan-binding domain-containing protein [Candidatus Atribacteria bacterium]|nr:LysM peptidoglycan-binding domain-containing protein [Candidatus Atribacteria bacterium]